MKTPLILLLLMTISFTGCATNKKADTAQEATTVQPTSQVEPQPQVSQMDDYYGKPMEAMLVNGKGFPFTDVQNYFEKFKASPEFPKIETRDLRTAPWGYRGSGSTLSAFYRYLAKQDNHGWHIDPPHIPAPPIEAQPK